MEKIKAIFRVFQIGQSVNNPALWKNGYITGSMVGSLLAAIVALLRAFGVDIHISDADLAQLGISIVIVWGAISAGITTATSTKVGLPVLIVEPAVPAIPNEPKLDVSSDRHAANGDIIDSSQRRE